MNAEILNEVIIILILQELVEIIVTCVVYRQLQDQPAAKIIAPILPYCLVYFRKIIGPRPLCLNSVPRASIVRIFQLFILQNADKYGRIRIGWRLCNLLIQSCLNPETVAS